MPIQNLKSILLGNKEKIVVLAVFLFLTSVLFLFLNYKTSPQDKPIKSIKQEEVFQVTPQAVSSVSLSLTTDKTPLYAGETANIALKTASVPASYKFLAFIVSIKVPKDFEKPVIGANNVAFPGITYDFPFSQVVDKTTYWEVQVLGANSSNNPVSLTTNQTLFTFPVKVATATTAIKTSEIAFVNISDSDIPSIISADETLAALTTNNLSISLNPAVAPTITMDNVTKAYGDGAFTITHSTNSTGAKTFTSSNVNVATITNTGLVTIVGAGTSTITLSVATAGNYTAGSKTAVLTVNKIAPTIVMDDVTKNVGDQAFTIAHTVNSTGAKTFTSSNVNVATITNAGVVTITGAGTSTITLSVGASGNYTAGSKTAVLTVNAIKGDLDGNGSVNVVDVQGLVVLIFSGNATAGQIARGDMNSDGKLDIRDAFLIVELIFK